MSRPRGLSWAVLLVVVALATWWLLSDTNQPTGSEPGSTNATITATPVASTDPESGLPIVAVADLPPEAATLLRVIDDGGPFDEDEDGGIFGNREELLPDQRIGYYREYTVPTPGSADRGARRIVAGGVGEFYWTGDHYRSFARIAR